MELTQEEKHILTCVAMDNELGGHLLGEKRSYEYWQLRYEWAKATKADNPTERQTILLEYVHQCTDYAYYLSLPMEKRMF